MADANHFITLWNGEFPDEDPPGMEWNAERTSLTVFCDKSTINLDCKNSFNAAQSILLKEEDLILEKLIRNIYCRNCLNSVVHGTPTRLLTKKQLKDFLGALETDDGSDPAYDIYDKEEEGAKARAMYSLPLKDRAKSRPRPPLQNIFINNGIVGTVSPVPPEPSPPDVEPEEDESGYDAVYEAIADMQISKPIESPASVSTPNIGGSMKLRSPLPRPMVPQRTFSLSQTPPEDDELPRSKPGRDRPYQQRPRTVFVDNPSAVAPPLPHRYQLPLQKVNSLPARHTHRSQGSDLSEESAGDSNYERVDLFKRQEPSLKSNGIYYSHVPLGRTEDHDGIYEDISEASKLANSLGNLSETRQSNSSLVSDDGVLEPDELRHMIHSFSTCPVDADAVYASLPRKCFKNLTCSLTQIHDARVKSGLTSNYNVSLPEIPFQSLNDSSSTASTLTLTTSDSSNSHEESQLDLDEMLGVLETDSQRKIYVASILDEKEYLQKFTKYMRILPLLWRSKQQIGLPIRLSPKYFTTGFANCTSTKDS